MKINNRRFILAPNFAAARLGKAMGRLTIKFQGRSVTPEIRRMTIGRCQKASKTRYELLIVWGPDADRRAKPLIYQAMDGSILDAYLHLGRDRWIQSELQHAREGNLDGLVQALRVRT